MANRKILKFEISIVVDPNEDSSDEKVSYQTECMVKNLLNVHLNPTNIYDGYGCTLATASWAELKQI